MSSQYAIDGDIFGGDDASLFLGGYSLAYKHIAMGLLVVLVLLIVYYWMFASKPAPADEKKKDAMMSLGPTALLRSMVRDDRMAPRATHNEKLLEQCGRVTSSDVYKSQYEAVAAADGTDSMSSQKYKDDALMQVMQGY